MEEKILDMDRDWEALKKLTKLPENESEGALIGLLILAITN